MLILAALTGVVGAQNTEIEFWTFIDPAGDNVRSQALAHIIETFEAENPGVTVKPQIVQWQQISPSLLRAVQARRVPDVVMIFSPFLPLQIAANSLHPITGYVNALSGDERADFVMPWSATSQNGEIYATFYELRSSSVFYRKDVFAELGLDLPTNLDELTEVAVKLKEAGYVGFTAGLSARGPSGFMEWFFPVLVGMDAPILNEDGTAAFNNDKVKRAVEWVYDAVHVHEILPLDVALLSSDDVEHLFDGGRTALMPRMTHRLETIRQRSGYGENVQPMEVVTFDGVAPPMVQGWTLVIPRGSTKTDEAWAFIKHWVSPEMQLYQSRLAGYIPVRQSVMNDPWFQTDEASDLRWAVEYAASNPFEFQFPENTERLYDVLARMFERILTGQMTPADGLAWAEREYNSGLR